MTPIAPPLRHPALLLLMALSLSACAVGHGVVQIKPPASATTTTTESKAFAKIIRVEDHRVFEASPSDPSIPSLGDANDINNPEITTRAVARKRGGFGMALGDIVLPEGQTVAGLVQSAAQKALQDKGYAVVEEGAPEYARAQPLAIEIAQFWSWLTPGLPTITIEFKATLKLTGDQLLDPNPAPVTSYAKNDLFNASGRDWTDLIQRGVNDLSNQIEARIRPATQN